MEQISEFIQDGQVNEHELDEVLEEFDIDELLENEIKAILTDVTKTKITFQAIQNSRRYLSNGKR
ncbi:hypothetical protein HW132_28830 [Brasilonema sp. CT11]|nr:hypothetical protein [Brasilonema sp. CT11]